MSGNCQLMAQRPVEHFMLKASYPHHMQEKQDTDLVTVCCDQLQDRYVPVFIKPHNLGRVLSPTRQGHLHDRHYSVHAFAYGNTLHRDTRDAVSQDCQRLVKASRPCRLKVLDQVSNHATDNCLHQQTQTNNERY